MNSGNWFFVFYSACFFKITTTLSLQQDLYVFVTLSYPAFPKESDILGQPNKPPLIDVNSKHPRLSVCIAQSLLFSFTITLSNGNWVSESITIPCKCCKQSQEIKTTTIYNNILTFKIFMFLCFYVFKGMCSVVPNNYNNNQFFDMHNNSHRILMSQVCNKTH